VFTRPRAARLLWGFDAGNLANVAKTLRKLHPAALLVLCGDDDRRHRSPHRHRTPAA
jgi:phage/plasmid primase-like uncharacterized protein